MNPRFCLVWVTGLRRGWRWKDGLSLAAALEGFAGGSGGRRESRWPVGSGEKVNGESWERWRLGGARVEDGELGVVTGLRSPYSSHSTVCTVEGHAAAMQAEGGAGGLSLPLQSHRQQPIQPWLREAITSERPLQHTPLCSG